LPNQDVTKNAKTDLAEKFALILADHPELEQIVLAWANLSVEIRRIIANIIETNE